MHVRPIEPTDADRLVAFHGRLSGRTIHYRFFTPRPHLRPREVERFTTVDHVDRVSLVAVLHDELVAVSRYDRLPGTDQAEVAFVVEDAHQGRGLGTILLEHLAAAARERGIRRFVASVLPDNWRMLNVFESAGWRMTNSFSGGVVGVEFAIDPTEEALVAQQGREHLAEARSVARLLHPSSLAVIGAGRAPDSYGHGLLRNILDGDFAGAVHVVHPSAAEIAGVVAVPSIEDVDGPVDLAVVVVPKAEVRGVVDQCGRKGVRGLVIITSGFADESEEGAEEERTIVAAAHAAGMRVLGPNTLGVINTHPEVRLHAVLGPSSVRSGCLGILTQSGGLGVGLLGWASRPGLGISTFVAAGNKSDVSGNDMLQYWADDERTTVVGLYLESFGNPRKFSRVARSVARRKPVLAVKSGRRDGSDVAVDALFSQAGVLRVRSVAQLLDAAALFANQPLPAGRRVRLVAGPGSPVLLATDAVEAAGLVVDDVVHLPGDDAEAYAEAVASTDADAVLALYTPPITAAGEEVARTLADGGARAGIPVLAVFIDWRAAAAATDGRLPAYGSPESAAGALGLAADYADWRRRDIEDPPLVSEALAEVPGGPADVEALLAGVGIEVLVGEPPVGAVELAIGVELDPTFGPLVTLAVAGPSARLIDDHAARITPLSATDASDLVRSLRTAPILFASVDTAPLEALLVRVGLLVEARPDLAALALAPVWLSSSGVVVAGASARQGEEQTPTADRRRLPGGG